jgi:hypothetical protein
VDLLHCRQRLENLDFPKICYKYVRFNLNPAIFGT